MVVSQPLLPKNSDAELFLRLWDEHRLTPTLARHLLKLQFDERDRMRMHDLAVKNQAGKLSAAKRRELDNYVRVGTLLSILQSRARERLRHRGNGRD
jgi:hypothetical protein